MSKPKRYQYDIFEPGSTTRTFLHIHENTPLMDFAVGDFIHGEFISNGHVNSRAPLFRIVKRRHVLWNSDGETIHQLLIYTEEVDGYSELPI